jgi:hypothetical protein
MVLFGLNHEGVGWQENSNQAMSYHLLGAALLRFVVLAALLLLCAQTAGQNGPGSTPPELWDVCRTGLGLYLVKQTLASMSSTLAASSELGKGSTFEFDMPLADSDCESESEADAELFSEPSRSVRGPKLLGGMDLPSLS